ncbi:MAG: DUF1801 domain-containing protein [Proteobacteria bacterium]|nr:DUF1801 domain-containing protein [Pseudomonadota bacterium]
MRPHRAATTAEYIASLPPEKRAALKSLRKILRAAIPDGEECISYGIPAIRWNGRVLVHFAAMSRHCSFFPGANPIRTLAKELDAYDTSKGTVRFAPDDPLPPALVRKLVAARMAEFAGKKPLKRRR